MSKKIQVVSMHIENDPANKLPTIVFTDINGVEWVSKMDMIHLEEKADSWYFKPENNHDNKIIHERPEQKEGS